MATSPSTLNYFLGKGTISWTPDGGAQRFLGNAPEIEITPEIETLEHFSSQSGTRKKDREVVLTQSLSLRIVLDEITAPNLQLLLMGDTPATNTAGNLEFNMMAVTEITGAIVITGTNDVGNQVLVTAPIVNFLPSGGLQLIANDDWGTIEVTADILADGSGFFGTVEVIDDVAPS